MKLKEAGMSSISIDRDKYPGKSDAEIAEEMAREYGFIAVVRYKNSADASEFTNFGTCQMEEEIEGYLSSPYCHNSEIIYDGRAAALNITEDLILNGNCELCGKEATRESLQLMAGNDFYICPECESMFCDECYPSLPLTTSPGYGTCPECRVEVQRALPGFYGNQSGAPDYEAASSVDTGPETPPDVELEDDITLHDAVIEKDLAKVRALIAGGADLQETDSDGATPLHYAAYVAHAELAGILLEGGADVDARNTKGQTPLHEVARHLHREGDDATITALLDAGASLSARDNDGSTPLHTAAVGGHLEAATILLDRGADIQTLAQQLTPLHFSAYAGKPEVTKLLIERGADVFAEKDGMDPLYMAQQPSHSAESDKQIVVQMLEQAMARGKRAPVSHTNREDEDDLITGSEHAEKQPQHEADWNQKKWWQFWK